MRSFLAVLSLAPLLWLVMWVVPKVQETLPPKNRWEITLRQLCFIAAFFGFLFLQLRVATVTGLRKHHLEGILITEGIIALVVFAYSIAKHKRENRE